MKKIILIGISLLTLTACNDAKKKEAKKNKYDARPFLGLPDYFKGKT